MSHVHLILVNDTLRILIHRVMAAHFSHYDYMSLFHTFSTINVMLYYDLLTYISTFLVLQFGWIKT